MEDDSDLQECIQLFPAKARDAVFKTLYRLQALERHEI